MSNKRKKTVTAKSGNKPKKTDTKGLKQEKVESINFKALARDERTWKIIGAVSLLIATFLFVAFISYFFTYRQDRTKVEPVPGSIAWGIIFDGKVQVSNLLGKLGALFSHFFIYTGFGIASLLICTFFFVSGVNLLFSRKVFSIWKNLKYVTIGLVLLSTLLAFILAGSEFRFGGGVGVMISNWLVGIFGTFGTAALLFIIALAYIIWQFNPRFNLPSKKNGEPLQPEEIKEEEEKLFIATKGNKLKSNGEMLVVKPVEESFHEFEVIEKDEPEEKIEEQESAVEKEVLNDLLHTHEANKALDQKSLNKEV